MTEPHTDADTDHAVVLGAGLAGLLAARALAERFPRVTLIERDRLPAAGPAYRPGVPQSRHVHVLWQRGLAAIEAQLPGTTAELLDAGAHLLNAPADLHWLSQADWFQQQIPGAPVLVAGRELIEWTVRRHVIRNTRIRLRDGHEATGLLPTPDDRRAVRGLTLRPRGHPDRVEQLSAGLVVDATGRTSHTSAWLTQLGFSAPPVTRCDAHLAYSSRYYRFPSRPPHEPQLNPPKPIYLQPRSDHPRAGVLLPIDSGRHLVTLLGTAEHAPPTRDPDFLKFTRTLRSPVLYETLREAEPLSSPVGFRDTANVRHAYDNLPDLPTGLLVLGDAACRSNPVYGYGMTVAALSARVLADETRGLDPTAIHHATPRLQHLTSATADTSWGIATGTDLRNPATDGPRPARRSSALLLQPYLTHTLAAANRDPAVSRALFAVMSLTAPPSSLLTPRILLRVLRAWNLPTAPTTAPYPPQPPLARRAGRGHT